MKRYIKLNKDNYIMDILFEDNDGAIYFDDTLKRDVHINGKCISDEVGTPLFQYINGKVSENYDDSKFLEYKKEQNNNIIKQKLILLDAQSVRPLRSILNIIQIDGKIDTEDIKKLSDLEKQAADLRKTLK